MQCDAPHGAQFLLAAVGPLPSPVASIQPPVISRIVVVSVDLPDVGSFVPDSPPPRRH